MRRAGRRGFHRDPLPDDDFELVSYGGSDYVIEFSLGCFGLHRSERRTLYVVGARIYLGSRAKVLLPTAMCATPGTANVHEPR